MNLTDYELIINNKIVKRYRKFSDARMIIEFIIKKKVFARDELQDYCFDQEIPENTMDVEIHSLNRACKKLFNEKFLLTIENKPTKYQINPIFIDNKVYKQLLIPEEKYKELKKLLEEYEIES